MGAWPLEGAAVTRMEVVCMGTPSDPSTLLISCTWSIEREFM